MEQIEEKRPDSLKEGEDVWHKKLYDWKKVYQFGAEEHLTTDGEVLNQIRRELLQVCENYFLVQLLMTGIRRKFRILLKRTIWQEKRKFLELRKDW